MITLLRAKALNELNPGRRPGFFSGKAITQTRRGTRRGTLEYQLDYLAERLGKSPVAIGPSEVPKKCYFF